MGLWKVRKFDDEGAEGDSDSGTARVDRLASELHEVVGTVRSRADLDELPMPELDRLCAHVGDDRETLTARAISEIEDPDYRRFFEVLLPLPFEEGQRWPPLGRKYISEEDAGRGVLAGFEGFGVTTWDGLNAPLRELDGMSRRSAAERVLAESLLASRARTWSRSRVAVTAVAIIAFLIAIATLLISGPGSDTESAGSSDPEASEDVGGESQAARAAREQVVEAGPAESATTVSLPESVTAGIQPGVEPIRGEDLSTQLGSTLAEENLIFFEIPDGGVADRSYYGRALQTLPARFRYQAFNGIEDLPECRGMMSRELEVLGLWERQITWNDGLVWVAVGHMRTPGMAHELATAVSIAAGVDPSECRGLGYYNIDDYEDYGVTHQDDPSLLTEITFNHWSEQDVVLPGGPFSKSDRVVVERGPYVIDVVLASNDPGISADGTAVASVVNQIVSRLDT